MPSPRRISYYYDPDVGSYSYGAHHPMRPMRMRIAHELVTAYDLLPKMEVSMPTRATAQSMTAFHTDEYIDFLTKVTPDNFAQLSFDGKQYLVGYDNPVFDGIFEFCSISAGGTLAAAKAISSGHADIGINWAGGLHHAKRQEASGFCYINDIVLGILELLRVYPRVLYIDIDCHHGDGVEEAFYTSDRVMTCSFHKFGDFFPGTGTQRDRGVERGFGYAVNVPLRDGLSDDSFREVFEPVISRIMEVFQPSAVVLQCGADSLSGDKLGQFNVSMYGHAACVQFVRSFDVPFVLLGGGGYAVKNAARAWTYETACAIGVEKDIDVVLPWTDYFEWFGPRYRLEVPPSNMEDVNLRDNYLERVKTLTLQQLSELKGAPSVGLHDTPRQALDEHLGLTSVTVRGLHGEVDDLDKRIAQMSRYVYELQEPAAPALSLDESDSSTEYDSEDAESRRKQSIRHTEKWRRRMSIISNDWYDLPPALDIHEHDGTTDIGERKGLKRRSLFDSGLSWDYNSGQAVVNRFEGRSIWPIGQRGPGRLLTAVE
ncbi:unnamed protein product [Peniophora sp. CBMAI 1063]|nr:unnamed protein product [Peniophora sp. CBMAI 1063]